MLLFAVTPCLVVVDHGVNPNLKKDLAKKMNHDLEKLSQWLKTKKLSLNIGKTKLIFSRPCIKNVNDSVKIKLKLKTLWPLLWIGFNCLKAKATLRRQFTLQGSSLPLSSQEFLVLILSTSEG